MKRTRTTVLLALGFATLAGAPRPAEAAIPWTNSMSFARQQAAAQRKPIMVYFYTTWCGWCKKLDADTLTDARVMAAAQNFVTVRFNAEGDGATEARQMNVKGYPHLIFLRPDGSEVERIAGYLPAPDFASEMNRIGRAAATGGGNFNAPAAQAAAPTQMPAEIPSFEVWARQQELLRRAAMNRGPRSAPKGILLAGTSDYTVAANGLILADVPPRPKAAARKAAARKAAAGKRANKAATRRQLRPSMASY